METVKLTNGKKTIVRTKEQYESNKSKFEQRGFKVQSNVKEKIVEISKAKKKKNVKKTKKKN